MLGRGLFAALCGLVVACAASIAAAQPYPSRPIRLIVPYAPAGNIDLNARIIGEAMSARLGQSMVIENRAGAGGLVGTEVASRAAPDGYTIVLGSTATFLVSPLIAHNQPYSLDSFTAIGSVSAVPLLLEARAGGRFADFASLAAFVMANPEQVSLGHAGNGTTNHIALLQLQLASGLRFNVIPYRGSGPALNDLIGGQVELLVDQISSSLAHIRAGRVQPLAVTSRGRSPDLPDVPTLTELGVGNFEVVTLAGLMAPAGTPAEIVKTLNTALNEVLADPQVRKRLADLGAEPRPLLVEDFAAFMRAEDKRMRALHEAGLFKVE